VPSPGGCPINEKYRFAVVIEEFFQVLPGNFLAAKHRTDTLYGRGACREFMADRKADTRTLFALVKIFIATPSV
jgi:hypothetical protein